MTLVYGVLYIILCTNICIVVVLNRLLAVKRIYYRTIDTDQQTLILKINKTCMGGSEF